MLGGVVDWFFGFSVCWGVCECELIWYCVGFVDCELDFGYIVECYFGIGYVW